MGDLLSLRDGGIHRAVDQVEARRAVVDGRRDAGRSHHDQPSGELKSNRPEIGQNRIKRNCLVTHAPSRASLAKSSLASKRRLAEARTQGRARTQGYFFTPAA